MMKLCKECLTPVEGGWSMCPPCTDSHDRMMKRREINLIDPDTGHTMVVPGPLHFPKPAATGTEAEVCKDIAERQQGGITKYNTTVRDNPLSLRQWLEHAYQECLDQAIYLKRAMEEMDRG